jgi:succinoglycan biosynthesis protein ExoO
MPRASVIIPAYNAADFIVNAYQSVADQTIDDWELIIVNDGSLDATSAIIHSIAARDKRVKVIDLSLNGGPAHARNAALSIAEGDWVAVLDADDRYNRDRLEVLTRAGQRAAADIVLDNLFVVDPISKRVAFLAFEPPQEELTTLKFADVLRNAQSETAFDFGYLKPVIRKSWLASHQIRYQEQLRLGEDLMLLFECFAHSAKAILVSKPYYYYNFQYSHISRMESPTTRTEAGCEPLLTAMEHFLEDCRLQPSRLETRLMASACEALREIVIAAAFKDRIKQLDIVGLVRCLTHPIRLCRGVYFERKRAVLLRRRAEAFCENEQRNGSRWP